MSSKITAYLDCGNKPPWTLPAKAAYSTYDGKRAKKYFGVREIPTPDFFPILSLFPQRALCYVKDKHAEKFIETFRGVFEKMWEDGKDVSKPEVLSEVLKSQFNEDEVRDILEQAKSGPYKQKLNDNTKEALELGAFGCPWFVVENSKGEKEPFFGSDRFHFMWEFLGLPWNNIELVAPQPAPKARI